MLSLTLTMNAFSQGSKWTVEASYPIPIDDNFMGENYNGILDIGAKYRFLHLNILNVGASLNGGALIYNSTNNVGIEDYKVVAYPIQSKVFAELDLASMPKFHPFVGLGYTLIVFDAEATGDTVSGEATTQDGMNTNFGIAYNITDKLFAQVQYDFVRLGLNGEIVDSKYNRNVNILKVGLGFRL